MALSKIGSNQIDSAASLTVDGTTKVADGTESAPSIVFDSDTNTGIYKKANDKLAFVTGGTERMRITDLGRIEFEVPTNQTGALQDQRLDWRNENNAGIMASIAVHREVDALAPAALVFRTSTNVDSASNSSDGEIAEKMRISSQGYVTMPNQPMFTVNGVSAVNTTPGNSQVLNFSGVYINVGGHFNISQNRFVAPVAGHYYFSYSCMTTTQGHTSNIVIRKNGGGRHSSYTQNATYLRHNIAVVEVLAANDYVDIVLEHGGIHAGFDHFSGFLIG